MEAGHAYPKQIRLETGDPARGVQIAMGRLERDGLIQRDGLGYALTAGGEEFLVEHIEGSAA